MRHRICNILGLGNPDPELLDNKGNLNKEFADAVLATYFKDTGFDFHIDEEAVQVGIEPAYQYGKLRIITIHKDKSKSFHRSGKSWGGYGSKLVSTTKTYAEYKRRRKFVKFVDEWHAKLFGENK